MQYRLKENTGTQINYYGDRPSYLGTARDALSNDRHESTARFEKPAKQVLALATEPQAKREARSVHTYQ